MRAMIQADLAEAERDRQNFLYGRLFAHDVLERFAREQGRFYRRPGRG